MCKWTENDILTNFNVFRSYCIAVENISRGIIILGGCVEGYSTIWDYTAHLIKEMCPNLSSEFINKFDDSLDKIVSTRFKNGLKAREPLPKDFDYYKDDFVKIQEFF